jgi:hypothetical protein
LAWLGWLVSSTLFAEPGPGRMSYCEWFATRLGPRYREFLLRQPNPRRFTERTAVRQALSLRPHHCGNLAAESRAKELFPRVVDENSGKIGVLLPMTGPDAETGLALRKGLEAALGPDSARMLVRDTGSDARRAEEALAELLFRENVLLVVAGGPSSSIAPLVPWSEALVFPMIVLAGEKAPLGSSRFAFRVYPREQDMAYALVESARQRGLRRLGLLRPDDGSADALIAQVHAFGRAASLDIAAPVEYQSGDFRSMEAAVRTLFHIDRSQRAAEYARLVKNARRRAEEARVPFDPRSVILKPIVEIDGLLVPDNFRIVRHFAKLLKYHGVKRLVLFGDTGWRSAGLLSPPEPFLEGSFFADFIGAYSQLPPGIAISTAGDFPDPREASAADFALIGWRAGRILRLALRLETGRRKFPRALARLPSPDPDLFGGGPAFDETRAARWPVYVFSVGPNRLTMEESPYFGTRAPAAEAGPPPPPSLASP